MEDTELLLTVAEIAVAFAGFSGLVTILGQRLGRVHPQLVEHTLRAMILTSLLAVSFSLFPFLPPEATRSENGTLAALPGCRVR